MEGILAEIATSDAFHSAESAATHCEQAEKLLQRSGPVTAADSKAVSAVVALFVEAVRSRVSVDEFVATVADYFPDAMVRAPFERAFRVIAPAQSELHETMVPADVVCVGVSSRVLHHIRDFAVRYDPTAPAAERPRSVANIAVALDVEAREVIAGAVDPGSVGVAPASPGTVAFQCTSEQAIELAHMLRNAAAALGRAQQRVAA